MISKSVINDLVWPALSLVTRGEKRLCGSGSTWQCLVCLVASWIHTHLLSFVSDILSMQLVNCDLLFFSVHTTFIAGLSVL